MTAAHRNADDSGGILVELRPPGGWHRPSPPNAPRSGRPPGPATPPETGNARDDQSWQDRANCLGVDPDLFFPGRGESTQEAKAICAGCVVRDECLEHALARPEKFGIWGGTSERERRRLRRARNAARRREGQVS